MIIEKKKIPNFTLLLATVFLLSFFLGSKNIKAANPPIDGVLRVNPVNSRYFTNDSGKAVYLAGWNTWGNLQDGFTNAWRYNWGNPFYGMPEGFHSYLEDLEYANLNYIRLWMYETPKIYYGVDSRGNVLADDYPDPMPWNRSVFSGAADGGNKFDLTQFNQIYFDRLRERVQMASEKGIYVAVMLFEGFSLYDADMGTDGYTYHSWKYHPFNPSNNINGIPDITDGGGAGHKLHTKVAGILSLQETYVRKVIDSVNEFDNVLFEIANESANTFIGNSVLKSASKEWELYMIEYIQDYEDGNVPGYPTKLKRHPVGATSNTFIYAEANVDADMLNSNVNTSEFVSPMGNCCSESKLIYYDNPPVADGRKIIIAETDHFGTWDIRGGSVPQKPYSQTEINKQIERAKRWPWKSFTRGLHPSLLRKDPDNALGWDEAVRRMGQTRTYAEKMDLSSMVPSASSADCSTTYCLRNPGQEYLVYQPAAGSFTVNLQAGNYDYEWFNPATGAVTKKTRSVATSSNEAFNPSEAGISVDSVLYLKKSNSADVNGDGRVNIKDIQEVIRCIINKQACNFPDRSDVNEDTRINIKDIQEIIRKIITS